VGDLFTVTGHMNCGISLAGRNFYIYLPKGSKEKKLSRSERDLLSTCLLVMEFRCGTLLCSNLGDGNSDAGNIKCLHGPKVPHPGFRGISRLGSAFIFFAMIQTCAYQSSSDVTPQVNEAWNQSQIFDRNRFHVTLRVVSSVLTSC